MLHDPTGNGQTQTAARRSSFVAVLDLAEFLENRLAVVGIDPDTVVGHIHLQEIGLLGQSNFDPAVGFLAEFHGIGQKVQNDLHQPVPVSDNRGHGLWQFYLRVDFFFPEQLAGGL